MHTQDLAPLSGHPDTIHVRSSRDGDIGAITSIYGHHVLHGTGSFENEAPDTEEMYRRRADVLNRGLPYLVAEDSNGIVLGYAYAGAYRPRAAYRNTVENSVYVRHDVVGRGIGRLLLAELLIRCEAVGVRQMVAVVGDSENQGSVRLHQAFGFRMNGTLSSVGGKHGGWLDTVLLQRSLAKGDSKDPHGGV
ncbi:N-acetyltransferase family protein [Roseomonas nepalensis]|uniref:N-acetyltransferase family protein n=1 Tax=Muricoccus nepalensis TaxID=1854500 RepID=A0A502G6B6_9PROT|nr:GNAT family N-acetyltransferase [Roseomonas nepalensis]TPG57379.1 N-acetyltransferase family protein [Roseomonas nepalensis]